jgi:hypothetical protein
MAAEHQSVAAVLSPRTFRPSRKISPAPRKPIPDTTWAATRVGLASPGTTAAKMTNVAAPSETNVNFINRQPLTSTELEIGYVVSLTCRSPDEAQLRALLLQGLAGSGLSLRRLDSNDVDGGASVVVTAFVNAPHRVDAEVERIVGRLSLEPSVSAARWQAEVHLESEGPALAINTGSRTATGATP